MDVKLKKKRLLSQLEDSENSPENSGDSSRSTVWNDTKIASTSSSKRSRRAIEKRVVSVRIKDIDGFRLKGDQMSAPPSDSWAWRKYGQKPIKGSPYPRGYYRCSSSKGCPARKQVERSRMDPNMLLITYYCEHNHPLPASRNHNHHNNQGITVPVPPTASNVTTSVSEEDEEEVELEEEEEGEVEEKKPDLVTDQIHHETVPEYKFTSLGEGPSVLQASEFGWLSDFESPSCTMLDSPILAEDRIATDNEMATIFTMREEDESLFADLGELPECSTVFRRVMAQQEAESRQHSLATTS